MSPSKASAALRRVCVTALLPVAAMFTAAVLAASADGVALDSGAHGAELVARSGGRPDLRFGDGGRVALPGMTAQQVLTDARGFHHVLGQRQGLPARLEVRRFVPTGRADTAWGEQGRASGALVDGAVARQGLLLSDGRLLIAGEVERLNAQAALWWVSADGRVDPGWLMLDGAPSSRVLSVVPTAGGGVMVGLLAGGSQGLMLEVHLWTPSRERDLALPERIGRQALPKGWTHSPVLQLRERGWFWVDPEAPQKVVMRVAGTDGDEEAGWHRQPAPGASTTATADRPEPASEPGGALYSPWAAPSVVAEAAHAAKPAAEQPAASTWPTLPPWLMAGALAALALAALLRRVRRFK